MRRLLIVYSVLSICFWTVVFQSNLFAQNAILTNPSACGLGLPITDNSCPENGAYFNPDRFVIRVDSASATGAQLGVDVYLKEVRLILLHSWTSDLDISLISPAGQKVVLSSDNGGGEDNYGMYSQSDCSDYVRFSLEACRFISEGFPPFIDSVYLPEGNLLDFNIGNTDPKGDWVLQICDDVEEDIGVLEYVELVFAPFDCLPILDLQIVEVDSTTFILDWTSGPNCEAAIIEYGPPGFTPGDNGQASEGVVRVTDVCPPYRLFDLEPGREYEVYVRKFCALSASYAPNSCSVMGTSGCLPPPATIINTFDEEDLCPGVCGASCSLSGSWRNVENDGFDWLVQEGSTATQGTGPQTDASGNGRYIYLETSGQDCNKEQLAILYSNCIQLKKMAADTCHLSFNYHMSGSGVGDLSLQASTNGGQSWEEIWSKTGNQGARWFKTYLSLNRFTEESILQFRFVGSGGSDSKGDIALDNIVFYGSLDLGESPFIYYADKDGDGYGDAEAFIQSCLGAPPINFVENGEDCNDTDPRINPDAAETPCNNIDENCNGQDDDLLLPPPKVNRDTICSGELAVLQATSSFDKPIFWYGSPEGNDFIGFGNSLFNQLPENDGPVPLIHRFYAEETDFSCKSENRAEAIVVVNPRPRSILEETPEVCPETVLNLNSIEITDANFTGAALSYHTADPPGPENRLIDTEILATKDTNFYFLQLTPEGCKDEGSIEIKVKSAPAISILPANTIELCREDTATVQVQAQGGAGGYAYFWSNGEFGANLPIKAARLAGDRQLFQVSVTDAEGCMTMDSLIVNTSTSVDSVRRIVQNVSNCLGADGVITVVPLNGVGPYNYRWLGSSGVFGELAELADTLQLENLPQGSYQLTITDSSDEQCTFITRQILVNGPGAVVEEVEVRDVSCFSAGDGQICLNVQGGAPNFLWSNGATTSCIDELSGGSYSVTLTEGDCETIIEDIVVEEPELLRVVANFSQPACFDSQDGAIELNTFGGTTPYQYRWANNLSISGPKLEGLDAGTYNLTVTDANRCLLLTSVELFGPNELILNVDSIRQISCPGAEDGFVKVSAQGGAPPYRYEWNTGRTSAVLPQLSPGVYTLSVTDFNGCVKTQSFTFEDPAPIEAQLLEIERPKCQGDNTGSIIISATGGRPEYRFQWSNGATDSTLTEVDVGAYSVTVSDRNQCPADTLFFKLEAQFPLTVSTVVIDPVCQGATNGAILLTPQGAAPFAFEWLNNPGHLAASLSGIGVGDHPVRITDTEGCELDTIIKVSAEQAFLPQINALSPQCPGSSDGVIDLSFIRAGLPPFNFEWSNGSREDRLLGVAAGDYQFTLTDVRGCIFVSDTIVLESPQPISSRVLGLGQITCQGESTGFIEIDIAGGNAPFSYNWIGENRQTKDIYNLPAGDYRLQVQDANNCPYDTTITLQEPSLLKAEVAIEVEESCEIAFVSKLSASASGGTAPYRFLWNNGAENPVLADLPSGDYQVRVEDENGCSDEVASIKVAQREVPIQLDTFFVSDITCRGADNGTMTASISGGTPPYRFHFSNNEITTTSNTSVSVGNLPVDDDYMVTITDLSNGCLVVSPRKAINEPPQLNLARDSTQDVVCFGASTGAVFSTVRGGIPPYKQKWLSENFEILGTESDLIGVPAGNYIGILIDQNGCADTIRSNVRHLNPALQLPENDVSITAILCKGETTGAIDVSVRGGRPPYNYRWNNGAFSEDLNNISAGNYTLSVTDAANCLAIFSPLAVPEPDKALNLAAVVRNVRCKGYNDGSIAIAPSGGRLPYQINWRYKGEAFGEDIAMLDSLFAGTYSVEVEDENGCRKSEVYGVAEPPLLSVDIRPQESNLQAEADGGVPPYDYFWSTGERQAVIDFTDAGTYSLTIIDDNGCRAQDTLTVVSTIDRLPLLSQARLYPNPAADYIYLEVKLKRALAIELRLVGLAGRTLYRRKESPTTDLRMEIPLGDRYPAGLYFVELHSEEGILFRGKLAHSP